MVYILFSVIVANVFDAALLVAEPKESERDLKIMPTKHPRAWDDVNDLVGWKSQFLNDLCSRSPVRKKDRQTDKPHAKAAGGPSVAAGLWVLVTVLLYHITYIYSRSSNVL